MTTSKILYILIGMPGTGKSTWVNDMLWNDAEYLLASNTFVYSTDAVIEEIGNLFNLDYDIVFSNLINFAKTVADLELNEAIAVGKNIIWDQTNLSVKSRKYKLSKIPNDYKKIAVVFPIPENHKEWLNRPGKNISDDVLAKMAASFDYPTLAEGFDEIEEVDRV